MQVTSTRPVHKRKLTSLQVTGGSGHLGFRVLINALESGYKVRVPLRSQDKIEAIKATRSIQGHLNDVEFVQVPDITQDGAFDDALVGVKFVIHSASPLAISVRPSQSPCERQPLS